MKPEVLCVGFNKTFDFRIYSKSDNHDDDDEAASFTAVDNKDKRFKEIYRREQTWYVVGEWTCNFRPSLKLDLGFLAILPKA